MANKRHVLVEGRMNPEIQALISALGSTGNLQVRTRLFDDVKPETIDEETTRPDIVIHFLGSDPRNELDKLSTIPTRLRSALLVVGFQDQVDSSILRLAMQAGARNYYDLPLDINQLVVDVRKILDEHPSDVIERHMLTAFVSPKGGSGASTVAEGVAHCLSTRLHMQTLLMDLDCQFGSQYLNLDLKPIKGLREALESVDTLDAMAFKGYVGQHGSGLHVMGTLPSQILLPGEVTEKSMNKLMDILIDNYDQIIVDLPRTIDSTFSLVVERMRRIVMVVQQDFQNIRNAQKMMHILNDELQVPSDRIALVINRHEEKNTITVQDIEKALQMEAVTVLPSDYVSVSVAANLGKPLLEHAPNSSVTKGIIELSNWVGGVKEVKEQVSSPFMGFLKSLLTTRA